MSATYFRVVAGIGSAFLVLAAVQTDLRLPALLHGPLTRLGNWSYALYLIHVPVLTWIYTQFMKGSPPWYVWPLSALAALAAAALLGELDQWLTRVGKRAVSAASAKVLAIAMALYLIIYFSTGIYSLTN